jgi:PAS domain S-box-containing protein
LSPHLPWAHGLNEVRFRAGEVGFGPEALAELLENVPVAIAVTIGREHRYAFANRLFRSALRFRTSDLMGKTAAEVAGDLSSPESQALRMRVFETGEPCELIAVPIELAPGEEPSYWDIKLLPVLDADDNVNGILTLGANVTDRVKAREEAERQSRMAAYENERLALAVAATELGLWEWDARTGETFWSDRQKEIFGMPRDQSVSYDSWLSSLHPDDRGRVVPAVHALLDPASGGQLSLEHRIVQPDGAVRWILSRGRMLYEILDGELKPARLLGTVLDITDRRNAEEARQLLVRELNHRVKNLFAVASSMVSLTARSAATPKDMAISLRGRLDALSRAHELIRPAVTEDDPPKQATSIDKLVYAVMEPHVHDGTGSRLTVQGPAVPTGPSSATGLTLVLHELATNAAKYGSLSVPDGRVLIRWSREDPDVDLVWEEINGPVVEGEPTSTGFGSQLARKSVTGQLGGEIRYDWRREGLRVDIRLPVERLAT